MSKQTNTTSNEARLFPFQFGSNINLDDKDFWKFPLDWVLGVRLARDKFEDDDGFFTAIIENYDNRKYKVSIFIKDFNKVFPTRKTKYPERCFAECYITPKDHATDKMLGLDGVITDGIAMTIVGPDFPKKEVCKQLQNIKTQLHNNFDQAKTIATLAIEWCDLKNFNETEDDM